MYWGWVPLGTLDGFFACVSFSFRGLLCFGCWWVWLGLGFSGECLGVRAVPVVIAGEWRQLAAGGVVAPARTQPSPVDVAKRS
jgi:hypothetical protein